MNYEDEKTGLKFWKAIDKIAEKQGISVSRLAVNSGLNISTFNKSKRISNLGKKRYPTLRTVLAVLKSSKTSWNEFIFLIEEEK
ncbi:MAG: hypothetical protein ACTSXL_01565 [Alphaproteobacteria bacterium]|nr:MAG: hypothetical protein B6I23_02445 [Rickettsiaceae bacterium 4572_127]